MPETMQRTRSDYQRQTEFSCRQAARLVRILRAHRTPLDRRLLLEQLLAVQSIPYPLDSLTLDPWLDGRFSQQSQQVGLWEWQYPFAPDGDPVVVIDIETTGLSPHTEQVIEVAMVRYEGGQKHTLAELVNPHRYIPSYITRLTGITSADVQDAPDLPQVLHRAIPLLEGATLVLHNASFDLSFLKPEFERMGYILEHKVIDTLAWSRKALPGLPRKNLDALIQAFDLEVSSQRHRALSDAEATLELARELYYMITAGQPRPLGDL